MWGEESHTLFWTIVFKPTKRIYILHLVPQSYPVPNLLYENTLLIYQQISANRPFKLVLWYMPCKITRIPRNPIIVLYYFAEFIENSDDLNVWMVIRPSISLQVSANRLFIQLIPQI